MDNGNLTRLERRLEPYRQLLDYAQASVLALLGILIVGSVLVTLMSILGVIPWLQIAATLGGVPIPWLGPSVQVLFTVFCASLLAFLPASYRILRLERSHRDFSLTMEDIEAAYRAAHAEDRAGAFALSGEFAAVRERLDHLRQHPALAHLEPEILEAAAQMSYLSRDLATVYSDDAVARAKTFLAQRQEDVERHRRQIETALRTAEDLKRWTQDVEAEEREAQRQIARLAEDLEELLPKVGYTLSPQTSTVLPISKAANGRDNETLN